MVCMQSRPKFISFFYLLPFIKHHPFPTELQGNLCSKLVDYIYMYVYFWFLFFVVLFFHFSLWAETRTEFVGPAIITSQDAIIFRLIHEGFVLWVLLIFSLTHFLTLYMNKDGSELQDMCWQWWPRHFLPYIFLCLLFLIQKNF